MDKFEKKISEMRMELQASGIRVGYLEDKERMSGEAIENWVLKQAQVEAMLLVAGQLRRIADALEGCRCSG